MRPRRGALFDGERCFLNGLSDDCPRCGAFFGVGTSMDDRRTHLKACTDAAAHDAHAKAQADAKAKKRQREDLDDAAATAQGARRLGGVGRADVEALDAARRGAGGDDWRRHGRPGSNRIDRAGRGVAATPAGGGC